MTASKIVAAAASGSGGGAGLDVDEVFSTTVYDGGTNSNKITNNVDLTEGGLVWIKNRGTTQNHWLLSEELGNNHPLSSNLTASTSTNVSNWFGASPLYTFNSDGFTTASMAQLQTSNNNYVSWTFRKASKFFQCIQYSGNSTAGRTISHNLGCTVGQVWVKRTSHTNNWICWHRGIANNQYLQINSTSQAYADGGAFWNNTTPSSTTVTLGTDSGVNATGSTYVMYVFAHNNNDGEFGPDSDQDIIKCGSFTTNSNGHVPEVNLGFEPQWIMIKQTNAANSWYIIDNMREYSMSKTAHLIAEGAAAESVWGVPYLGVPTATGFDGQGVGSGIANGTFIYMAIRRGPLAAPEDATKVFAIDAAQSSSGSGPAFISGFVTDHMLGKSPSSTNAWLSNSRLTGTKYMQTSTTGAEANSGSMLWDYNNGVWEAGAGSTRTAWMWKRAPGYFDVVAWTTGSLSSVKHNLGVKPDLVILKYRGAADSWYVYNSATTGVMLLESNGATLGSTDYMASTTATDLNVGLVSNSANKPIAFLFATLAGVSKISSVVHSGTTNVDAGFSNGSRFVLLKRTDATGDWLIWDGTRGIVSGNDPYLALNSTAAEVTNTDYIDPLSSGFTLTSNLTAGTYIYYAIA